MLAISINTVHSSPHRGGQGRQLVVKTDPTRISHLSRYGVCQVVHTHQGRSPAKGMDTVRQVKAA